MAQQQMTSSQKALMLELKSLQEEPVEGFRITLVDESDLYNWEVAIFGPPNTLYEGGYFKAHIKFPIDYPYSPPTFRFLTKMWHPNIYENGDVCISILHPPVDDPQSGELPSERWNPTQNVRTILLSVISLLNEPNTFSPANVDASVMFRKWRDSKGKDKEYAEIIRARGVGCRQCPGNATSSCRTVAAALISLVPIVCYFNQYQVPSAFTNQGLLYVAMIFVFCWGGPVRKRAVFFSVGKIPL
ncbi:ubiquitin-conjugating enzyme E2 R2 isoform X1 [Bubalus kerabau]|uniref:ubiquitin-conjugating enzyme E2 R2 isoform X1 n=1 Tax=Bubalus carabanensis TaxID=3119969 RepID=UPI00244EFF2F|nr:ubiquitin-conjugating enzyme E2 R2 isoform X1 [Bubalus carabanensis]